MSYTFFESCCNVLIFASAIIAGIAAFVQNYYDNKSYYVKSKKVKINCLVVILICVSITALGNFGKTYYNNKNAAIKENNNQQIQKELLNRIDTLNLLLKPFVDLAIRKFPNEREAIALEKLHKDIEYIDKRTKITIFKFVSNYRKSIEDNKYETVYLLKPEGTNLIPYFFVGCITKNGAKINNLFVKGITLPMSYVEGANKDSTKAYRKYQTSFPPCDIEITIITDRDPGRMDIKIEPFKL